MSSVASSNSTEKSPNYHEMENSELSLNQDKNEIIIENNSSEVTITKTEINSNFSSVPATTASITMKTQVLPFVYIQTPAKVPFTTINKVNNTNMIVNSLPQFQFATIGPNILNKSTQNVPLTNVAVSTNQNVIFTPVNTSGKQQLIIQKQPGNVLPIVPVSVSSGAKITGPYLTMLKPTNPNKIHLTASGIAKSQDNTPGISCTPVLQTSATQKYVFSPMPKLTTNRLPATVTTNAIQSKITFMPLPISKDDSGTKQILNFQISDGQIQSADSPVTVMCDSTNYSNDIDDSVDADSESKLVCDEVIDLESPEKSENKSYELSITEESLECKKEVKLNFASVERPFDLTKFGYGNKLPVPRDPPKFPKHGVSILKKNYSFSERKVDKPNFIICNISNSNTSISDKEKCDITLTKPSTGTEETIVLTGPKATTQKTERRRKSNFSYRKDYDDMDITSSEKQNNIINLDTINISVESSETTSKLSTVEDITDCKDSKDDAVEIEAPKEKTDINMNDDCDLQKILKWEEGVGTLPGSNLKFIINEFNLVEYVTHEEYCKIIERRIAKAKEKVKDEFQEEMRCLECGCYGLPSEFISPKYCSYDCQETGEAKVLKEKEKLKRKKKKTLAKKESFQDSIKSEKDQSGSEDEDTSNENSHDKYLYPWACAKKGFSWSKYLEHLKVKAAPVKLFKDPFPYYRNGFRLGMKLEGVDPQHPSYFCVLSVAEVCGYRIRLHFDGYPDNYDFWVNADSMDIFPMGWCEKYGHVLQPPSGFTVENFNWVQYLKCTKSTAAPKHLFNNRAGNAICPNGFRVGMKLEAVDRKNTSLVCVASVRDMMDSRILVHFDSWDYIYDYWVDPTSPYIHPVGWCDQYGHNLTPPNDYPSPETFSWETYLKESKSVAAPVRAFKQRPASGFKRGMRLECVDKRVPQLIRVATVDDVREHQLRIHFDGWPDRYSYWVDDDSPDIHPVGWCQKTGHPIEPPLTPDDVYDFLECPTVGCRGQGHVSGPKFLTHSTQKYCPYAEENIDIDRILPDRLLSPDRAMEAVIPVSREPKEKVKPRLGRPPKYPKLDQPIKSETSEEPTDIKPKRKYKKRIKVEDNGSIEEKIMTFIEESKVIPAEKESWEKHSRFLKHFVNVEEDPRTWTCLEVADFISSLPSCHSEAGRFKKEEIDGEAFLSLSQKDILSILKVKVGPAIKLYNSIVLLRQRIDDQVFT